MELLRKDDLFPVFNEEPLVLQSVTIDALKKVHREDQKDRPNIVLILGEENATLMTLLLLSDASTKAVWQTLTYAYQKENIISKLNVPEKVHTICFKEGEYLQEHLTKPEQIFLELLSLNDRMMLMIKLVFYYYIYQIHSVSSHLWMTPTTWIITLPEPYNSQKWNSVRHTIK